MYWQLKNVFIKQRVACGRTITAMTAWHLLPMLVTSLITVLLDDIPLNQHLLSVNMGVYVTLHGQSLQPCLTSVQCVDGRPAGRPFNPLKVQYQALGLSLGAFFFYQ